MKAMQNSKTIFIIVRLFLESNFNKPVLSVGYLLYYTDLDR